MYHCSTERDGERAWVAWKRQLPAGLLTLAHFSRSFWSQRCARWALTHACCCLGSAVHAGCSVVHVLLTKSTAGTPVSLLLFAFFALKINLHKYWLKIIIKSNTGRNTVKGILTYADRSTIWQYTLEVFRKYTSINPIILPEFYPDELWSYVYLKVLYALSITKIGNLHIQQ